MALLPDEIICKIAKACIQPYEISVSNRCKCQGGARKTHLVVNDVYLTRVYCVTGLPDVSNIECTSSLFHREIQQIITQRFTGQIVFPHSDGAMSSDIERVVVALLDRIPMLAAHTKTLMAVTNGLSDFTIQPPVGLFANIGLLIFQSSHALTYKHMLNEYKIDDRVLVMREKLQRAVRWTYRDLIETGCRIRQREEYPFIDGCGIERLGWIEVEIRSDGYFYRNEDSAGVWRQLHDQ